MEHDGRCGCRLEAIVRQGPRLATILLLLSLAGGYVMADKGTDGVLVQLAPDDAALVERGESLYQQHCSACHGRDLQGEPDWRRRKADGLLPAPPHDETGHTWHHADDLLFELTKYGTAQVINDPTYRSAMPAYENVLSDRQIIAILSFIKSRWPARERQWQDEINDAQIQGLGFEK